MKIRGGQLLDHGFWEAGTAVTVSAGDGSKREGIVTELPMEASSAISYL